MVPGRFCGYSIERQHIVRIAIKSYTRVVINLGILFLYFAE